MVPVFPFRGQSAFAIVFCPCFCSDFTLHFSEARVCHLFLPFHFLSLFTSLHFSFLSRFKLTYSFFLLPSLHLFPSSPSLFPSSLFSIAPDTYPHYHTAPFSLSLILNNTSIKYHGRGRVNRTPAGHRPHHPSLFGLNLHHRHLHRQHRSPAQGETRHR